MAESTMSSTNKFQQGVEIRSTDSDFNEGIQAAVDYRGDVTLIMKDGRVVEGFMFNSYNNSLELFPKNSPQKASVPVSHVSCIQFSGKDEAMGKSWEDYAKKKAAHQNQNREVLV